MVVQQIVPGTKTSSFTLSFVLIELYTLSMKHLVSSVFNILLNECHPSYCFRSATFSIHLVFNVLIIV